MATGDKHIFAFANRDSLKYKASRDYFAGAVVLYTDGSFYEANGDVSANTAWEAGTTGATWKRVGGGIPDWVLTGAYLSGDLVFNKGAIWEANADISANTAWAVGTTGATWKVKAGLVNEEHWVWDETDNTLYPATADEIILGSATNNLAGLYTKWMYFYDGQNNLKGYLNVETDNTSPVKGLGLYGGANDLHIGHGISTADMTFQADQIFVNKTMEFKSGVGLRFFDNDSEHEGVDVRLDGNDLAFYGYLNDVMYTEPVFKIGYSGAIRTKGSIYPLTNSSGNIGSSSYRYDSVFTESLYFYYSASPASGNDVIRSRIYTNSVGDAIIDAEDGNNVILENSGGRQVYMSGGGSFRPTANDTQHLGSSSMKWDNIYATNGSIQTSDEREKEFTEIPESLLDVWLDYVKPMAYQWKKKVAEKGDAARIHHGIVAQDVVKAFIAAGLDWTKYAVVCASFPVDELDNPVVPDDFNPMDIDNLPPLMVRYDHVNIIEMAVQRRRLDKLETMLNS